MLCCKCNVVVALLFCGLTQLYAQPAGLDFKVFGYFQASFRHENHLDQRVERKSFGLQQLNLFLQKDLAPKWRTFVNFEFVNSYSSFRNWGAQNLEEAWVSYRRSEQFNLKLGLLTPTFNYLNEIKNRTPVLPYIIRPLAYEASLNDYIALGEFAPAQAFVQVGGFIPAQTLKLDYAVFVGNSPNINSDPRAGQTGVDTTKFFLIGGRFGIHTSDFNLGLSTTLEHLDLYRQALNRGYEPSGFRKVPRLRLGGDFSLEAGKWRWESEFIRVTYDEDHPALDLDKDFYYGTLRHEWTEHFQVYAGYWVLRQKSLPEDDLDIFAWTAGAAYDINETLSAKAQYGRVRFESSGSPRIPGRANYYYLAISAFF